MPLKQESPLKGMMNVGVTANLMAPLSHFSAGLQSSSTDTDEVALHSKYQKFINEKSSTQSDETSDNFNTSKTLYQLKAMDDLGRQKITPSKIEFLLYRRAHARRLNRRFNRNLKTKKSHSSIKRLLESESKSEEPRKAHPQLPEQSFIGKLKKSLGNMRQNRNIKQQEFRNEPESKSPKKKRKRPKECRIDIYPFDHGCAEYFRTTDLAPQIVSEVLAQRATDYATRFWAELFGGLHIGVAFVLTFFLQAYRFFLYSLVKSAVVGFLQMTSDYGLKPLLAVLFNGFLQPSLIFVHNVMSSMRDFLKPVSETVDNFLKPVGSVLRCVRLVTINEGRAKKVDKGV